MTDQLTATVVDSLDHVATRRSELDQTVTDARAEIDHLDELEAWLNAYPKLPQGEEETPADPEPDPEPDSPRAPAPASPARPQGPPPSSEGHRAAAHAGR